MNKIKLKNYYVLLFLLLLLVTCPPRIVLSLFPFYLKIAIRFIGFTILFIMSIKKIIKEKRIDFFIILMFIYVLWFLIDSLINKSNGINIALYQIVIAMSGLLFVYNFHEYKKYFIYCSYFYFLFFIILNIIFDLLTNFKDIVFMNTNDNFYYYIPMLLFSFLILEYNSKFVHINFILYLIMIITSFIQDATSTSILIPFFIIYYYLFNNNKWHLVFNAFTYCFIFVLSFFLIVWLGSNSPILPLFSSLLHKTITLSGRTPIYDLVVPNIMKRPIIGYGVLDYDLMFKYINFTHCHSIILDQLFKGGLIGLVLFCIVIIYVVKHTIYINNFDRNNYLLLTFLFVFLIRNVLESPPYDSMAYFLSLSYYLSSIPKKYINL